MDAIDVSNYTNPLTPDVLAGWRDNHNVGLVIVQAINPPPGYPAGRAPQQIQACIDAGMAFDAYVWLWFDSGIDDIQAKLALLAPYAGKVRRLWLDVEDSAARKYNQADTEAKVQAALNECDGFATWGGDRTGVYTGRWYWGDAQYMANTTTFADRDLWDANYDGDDDPSAGWHPYGGWEFASIKQYEGSIELDGIGGIDRNVLHPTEEAKIMNPPTDPAPAPEIDYGWLEKKNAVVTAAGETKALAQQVRDLVSGSSVRKSSMINVANEIDKRMDVVLG